MTYYKRQHIRRSDIPFVLLSDEDGPSNFFEECTRKWKISANLALCRERRLASITLYFEECTRKWKRSANLALCRERRLTSVTLYFEECTRKWKRSANLALRRERRLASVTLHFEVQEVLLWTCLQHWLFPLIPLPSLLTHRHVPCHTSCTLLPPRSSEKNYGNTRRYHF